MPSYAKAPSTVSFGSFQRPGVPVSRCGRDDDVCQGQRCGASLQLEGVLLGRR